MAKVADLREQVLLEVYLLGLRIGDVTLLKWRKFDQSGQTPIPIEINTKKEQVVARTFISEEFKQLLDKYLPLLDRDNPYLFQSKRKQHLSTKQIDNILKGLIKRAGIVNHGLFRWHTGRKLFLRTCAELGISSWSAKLMCGKAIPASDDTYVHDAELKNYFLKISEVLRLFPKIIPQAENQIKKLKDALRQVEDENYIFKTRLDLMQEDLHKLKESVDKLYLINVHYPMTVERTLFNKKTKKMERWTETINTPEELAEANKKFQDRVKKVSRDRS